MLRRPIPLRDATQIHGSNCLHPFDVSLSNSPYGILPQNDLPRTSPKLSDRPSLHIFTDEGRVKDGSASYNPTCLKWQVYLKFQKISFELVSSNNHASPTGSLPFILPPGSQTGIDRQPVAASKITRWADGQSAGQGTNSAMQEEAYLSLIDNSIRNAWLFHMYLNEENFHAIAYRLYIEKTSRNPIVQATLTQQLKAAAKAELLKQSMVINENSLFANAKDAFHALASLLGENEYFSSKVEPGYLDACVFAYTHLLLDGDLGWKDNGLTALLETHENLLNHQRRIRTKYFPIRDF